MRGHFQQVGRQLVAHTDTVVGWLLSAIAITVYLLTMEPSVSFWDSGEFISISLYLQVGHPPGAPFYQLLAHTFCLLAGGDMMKVALYCNALSAVAAGLSVMFLYWNIRLLQDSFHKNPTRSRFGAIAGALIGSLCYLFCDTAWFSAVESEVYSLAMLIASAALWSMLRWYGCADRTAAQRWLLLTALLLGLGYCTHQLTLLTTPSMLLIFLFKVHDNRKARTDTKEYYSTPAILRLVAATAFFFILGLTPYLIIPIRAAANTPINEGNPSTIERFKTYLAREQYEKAPIYPRMWRHHENEAEYAASWSGGDTSFIGNIRYYFSYQLTYMYFRYLMWNFAGRYNDRQGYGSPQNGQFITGIPPIDRLLVSTAAPLPSSLPKKGHNVYYLLPLLLGLAGALVSMNRKRAFWTTMTLFLMGGIILSVYLNHPCYEPRERDYAYILSFYAFSIFIALGAEAAAHFVKIKGGGIPSGICILLMLGVPLLMACQNWDDHDRSRRFIAHDAGANILNSCDSDEHGAVLFCYGDNDTFPLWYLQTVEKERLDIRVENIGLIGTQKFAELLGESWKIGRPVYFTHYAYNQYHHIFEGCFQLEGNAYRLLNEPCDSVAVEPFYRHVTERMGWQPMEGVYVDATCCKFLEQYWADILLLADHLNDHGLEAKANTVLTKTLREIPLVNIQDLPLTYRIGKAFHKAGNKQSADLVFCHLRTVLKEQLDYYHTMPPERQAVMPYTLTPREELATQLGLLL